MTPSIETPRLLLRPWRDSDREPCADMWADPRVVRFLGPPKERASAIAEAETLAARLIQNGYGWWIVEVKRKNSFVGVVILQDVPFDAHFTPSLEVGWHLAAEHWGNGYATEGARGALAFAFNELGRTEVVAMTAKINLPSQRVMQRLGMTHDVADDFQNPRVAQDSPLRPHVSLSGAPCATRTPARRKDARPLGRVVPKPNRDVGEPATSEDRPQRRRSRSWRARVPRTPPAASALRVGEGRRSTSFGFR
jgi:RimJ/RimL family protein N-acetyltransferase